MVVEDMQVTYDVVLRDLEKLLSMEDFEFINVQTIPSALDALEQDWDAILMDYGIGFQCGERGESCFRNGADLVAYRRALEKDEPEKKKVHIIGFSASNLRNDDMVDAGASCSVLKHDALPLAEALAGLANIKKIS